MCLYPNILPGQESQGLCEDLLEMIAKICELALIKICSSCSIHYYSLTISSLECVALRRLYCREFRVLL